MATVTITVADVTDGPALMLLLKALARLVELLLMAAIALVGLGIGLYCFSRLVSLAPPAPTGCCTCRWYAPTSATSSPSSPRPGRRRSSRCSAGSPRP